LEFPIDLEVKKGKFTRSVCNIGIELKLPKEQFGIKCKNIPPRSDKSMDIY